MGMLQPFTSNSGSHWKLHILTSLGALSYIPLCSPGQHSSKQTATSVLAATIRISKVAAKWGVYRATWNHLHRTSVRIEESKNLNFSIVYLHKPPLMVTLGTVILWRSTVREPMEKQKKITKFKKTVKLFYQSEHPNLKLNQRCNGLKSVNGMAVGSFSDSSWSMSKSCRQCFMKPTKVRFHTFRWYVRASIHSI